MFFLCASDNDLETALNAQAGHNGKPCDGRDLHVGDLSFGMLTPGAPLAMASCSLLGMAMAFKRRQEQRIAISFIGEGGSSLGEWHEAINFAAVLELPMIFCIENNQTALSTPVQQQSRAKRFADKALGYGLDALSINGNDVEEVALTFKFARDYIIKHEKPILIEVKSMRMCGHAHHDDMLYLGHDPKLDFSLPDLKPGGYVNAEKYEAWRQKDPISIYETKLINLNYLSKEKAKTLKAQAQSEVKDALNRVLARDWPRINKSNEELVFSAPWYFLKANKKNDFYQFSKSGSTYLQAIALAHKKAFELFPECLVIGEDVAPPYGNAFMLYKSIMDDYPERFINTPISENAIVGACVGMALEKMKPIGEIQFNDFIACAMNQVVNNVAKTFYRLGKNLPLLLRLPYGGLRRAGPFHSQDSSPWFYRTSGLKIMAPSTPLDAYYMLLKAIEDPDPVLFYEHIALYRDPKIKQDIISNYNNINGASIIKEGKDITIISYGAYVHIAYKQALRLEKEADISAELIDLRYLNPLDYASCFASIKKTSRVLLLGEDARSGSIFESLASRIAEELFLDLDAPVTVLGSRNSPVPYAPSLEDDYLLSEQKIFESAVSLVKF